MSTTKVFLSAALLVTSAALSGGCASEPKSEPEKQTLRARSNASLVELRAKDPSLEKFMQNAYGYAVFPAVGKGAFIVGGAHGRGEVYEQGQFVGYADITQATVGLQAGGQTFMELIVFENKAAMDRFKYGKTKFAANASAVALKAGAAASAKYQDGVAVFTQPIGGLMFEASVGGQEFGFTPADAAGGGPTGGGPATQPVSFGRPATGGSDVTTPEARTAGSSVESSSTTDVPAVRGDAAVTEDGVRVDVTTRPSTPTNP